MIILIIGHFSTSAKFREILWQYQKSTEKGKFCSLARNFATCRKVCALVITIQTLQRER